MCTRRGGLSATTTGGASSISAARVSNALSAIANTPATDMMRDWDVWDDPSSDRMINPLIGAQTFTDAWWNQSSALYDLEFEADSLAQQAGDSGPTIETVRVDSLRAMQPDVSRNGVANYVRQIASTGAVPDIGAVNQNASRTTGRILIIRVGGQNYVDDGNHRAAAARLLGVPTVQAEVYDIDRYMRRGARVDTAALRRAGLLS